MKTLNMKQTPETELTINEELLEDNDLFQLDPLWRLCRCCGLDHGLYVVLKLRCENLSGAPYVRELIKAVDGCETAQGGLFTGASRRVNVLNHLTIYAMWCGEEAAEHWGLFDPLHAGWWIELVIWLAGGCAERVRTTFEDCDQSRADGVPPAPMSIEQAVAVLARIIDLPDSAPHQRLPSPFSLAERLHLFVMEKGHCPWMLGDADTIRWWAEFMIEIVEVVRTRNRDLARGCAPPSPGSDEELELLFGGSTTQETSEAVIGYPAKLARAEKRLGETIELLRSLPAQWHPVLKHPWAIGPANGAKALVNVLSAERSSE